VVFFLADGDVSACCQAVFTRAKWAHEIDHGAAGGGEESEDGASG
jgi:hypothetical protein